MYKRGRGGNPGEGHYQKPYKKIKKIFTKKRGGATES
jgi:hypothetical protein